MSLSALFSSSSLTILPGCVCKCIVIRVTSINQVLWQRPTFSAILTVRMRSLHGNPSNIYPRLWTIFSLLSHSLSRQAVSSIRCNIYSRSLKLSSLLPHCLPIKTWMETFTIFTNDYWFFVSIWFIFIFSSLPWMDILVTFSQGHWQRSPACLLFSATRDKLPLFVPSVCIITPQFRHSCSIHCPNKLASSLPNSSRMRLPPMLANYWSGHGEAAMLRNPLANWNN